MNLKNSFVWAFLWAHRVKLPVRHRVGRYGVV
jgi:hypothetical protein